MFGTSKLTPLALQDNHCQGAWESASNAGTCTRRVFAAFKHDQHQVKPQLMELLPTVSSTAATNRALSFQFFYTNAFHPLISTGGNFLLSSEWFFHWRRNKLLTCSSFIQLHTGDRIFCFPEMIGIIFAVLADADSSLTPGCCWLTD